MLNIETFGSSCGAFTLKKARIKLTGMAIVDKRAATRAHERRL
jgi:hypothetical protein